MLNKTIDNFVDRIQDRDLDRTSWPFYLNGWLCSICYWDAREDGDGAIKSLWYQYWNDC